MKIKNIKFKAKRLDGKGWVCGDLLHSYENGAIIVPIEGGGAFSVATSTVCQFTGLKDCNGNEVWEGDILLDTIYGRLYTVMRSGYGAFFIRKNKSVNDDMYLFELIEEDKCIAFFEVVGNKFDKEK